MADAMKDAGITKEQVGYINAHGTSTPLNDAAESAAIEACFGDYASQLKVSSTKSMTGHMLGAAGAVECIASALALRDGVLPPTIGLREPDPACDLDYVPLTSRAEQRDLALSVSLGFGGHNGCVALRRWNG